MIRIPVRRLPWAYPEAGVPVVAVACSFATPLPPTRPSTCAALQPSNLEAGKVGGLEAGPPPE